MNMVFDSIRHDDTYHFCCNHFNLFDNNVTKSLSTFHLSMIIFLQVVLICPVYIRVYEFLCVLVGIIYYVCEL